MFEQFGATDTIPGANYPLPNVISPSQIVSDQDNYAPTGWADADVVRLDFDTGGRAITGFAAWTNTRPKRIVNTSANFGYLPCEHPDSSASNRIVGICDHVLEPYGTLVLEYDDTSDRVRIVGNSFNPAACSMWGRGFWQQVSVGATLGSDWGNLGVGISGGDNATLPGTATLPGAWEINTSTSATGASSLFLAKTVANPAMFGNGLLISSAYIYIPTLSDGTQTFAFSHGLVAGANSTALDVNNSVVIKYTHSLNSGSFTGVCRNNAGSESSVNLNVTVATNTPYVITVCHDKANSEARFYVNGVMAGRVTGSMPNAVACGCRTIIVKSAGLTSRGVAIASKSFASIN